MSILDRVVQTVSVSAGSPGITAAFGEPVTPGNTLLALHHITSGSSEPVDPTADWTKIGTASGVNRVLAVHIAPVAEGTANSHSFMRATGSGIELLTLFEIEGLAEVAGSDFKEVDGQSSLTLGAIAGLPSNCLLLTGLVSHSLGTEIANETYTPPAGYLEVGRAERNVAVVMTSQARPSDDETEGPLIHSWLTSARAGGFLVALSFSDAGPTIGPISTDDTVSQGETGLTFRVSGFTSTPTSVTLNGVSLAFTHEMVIGGEGDIDITLTDPIPLDLAEGSYDLVVSNDDETATKSIGYVVTHPVALPDPGEYDSNSILAGLGTSFPAGSFALLPTLFVGDESITPTFKAPYTGWHDADLTLSIDDILEAPEGVFGTFSATAEALFPDGTTDTWVITLEVAEPIEPAIVVTLRDAADSSAVVNTGNIVVWVLSLAHPSTVLYSTDEAMTDEAGQLVIESDALVVDDVVQLVVSLPDGRTTCAQVTVEDIAA